MSEPTAFSYVVDVAKLPAAGIERQIDLSADECAAVAGQLGLEAVTRCAITLRVTPWRQGGATLHGTVAADVVQTCVVTLEPVSAHVADSFTERFLPAHKLAETQPTGEPASEPTSEVVLSADGDDGPEPLGGANGTSLDAGDVAVQILSLALDPYPRKAGATLPVAATPPKEPSPFAVLAALQRNNKTD